MTRYCLKDLIEISKDGEWGKSESFKNAVEMICIRGTDFPNARFGTLDGMPRRHIAAHIAAVKTLKPWDVLIETAGGTKDQITGRTVLLRPRVFRSASAPLICASFSRFMRFRSDLCDPEFMFWYLQYLYFAGFLHAYHTQHTGVARFQWTTFAENAPILLPHIRIQRRVAAVLSAFDEAIANNLRRIQILDEMARTLHREWFVELRFPGHTAGASVPGTQRAPLTEWTEVRLSEIVDTQYGYTESACLDPVGPRYLRGMDINKRSWIDWQTVPYCPIGLDDKDSYSLRNGDVVVIRMADPGKVGIVEQDVDAVFASYLIRLTPRDERLLPYFLFYTLLSDAYQAYISGAATGTTRKSASAGVITDFRIAVPPRALLEKFERQIRTLRQLLVTLVRANANLRATRDLLLPRLLSGQLTLADIADDPRLATASLAIHERSVKA